MFLEGVIMFSEEENTKPTVTETNYLVCCF